MRKFQREVAAVWSATVDDEVVFSRGSGPEVDTEKFAIITEAPTITLRTLDQEFFQKHVPSYSDLRSSRDDGKTLRGLTVVRNSHVHSRLTTDPNLFRVVGPMGPLWRLYASWPNFDDLPSDIQTGQHSPSATLQAVYEQNVAGRDVIDTLLDALKFFVVCDPSIAKWTDDDQLDGFPLPELAGPSSEYQRMHPFAKSLRDWQAELFAYARTQTPASPREITGAIEDGGVIVCYVGMYQSGHRSGRFYETPSQVGADVANGAQYKIGETPLTDGVSGPVLGSVDLDEANVPLLGESDAVKARSLLDLQNDDADLYIRERKQ